MKKAQRNIKKAFLYVTELFRLPHIVLSLILLFLSVLAIIISYKTKTDYPFLSSVLSNVFAGLITGIAICLITGTKQLFNYKTEKTIAFLKEVHQACLSFGDEYKKMIEFSRDKNNSREDLFDIIYDVVCNGNEIDNLISQGQFNKTIPFNPYSYFTTKLNYDAIEQKKKNSEIRESILYSLNADTVTSKELIILFRPMVDNVFTLNGKVLSKIREIEIRKNISGKTFI